MLRIWEAHTVVAKSPQTVPNVGIQRIGRDVGMWLDPSLSSGSKDDTCLPACLCMVRRVVIVKPGTRGENCEVHPCSHVCYTYQTSYQKTTGHEEFCSPAVFGHTRDIAVLLDE